MLRRRRVPERAPFASRSDLMARSSRAETESSHARPAGETAGDLSRYRTKRDFTVTAEPEGRRDRAGKILSFVVQKHAARRLHYDLRLELDGVLISWAVTRGPSLVPGMRRLAVEVGDHPLSYATFEGVIPEGQYGAGTVIVWDRGAWVPEGDPHESLDQGRLTFDLAGERLRGRWHLVRTKPRGKVPQWLLMKGRDVEARAPGARDILGEHIASVLSGRSNDDLVGKPTRRPVHRPVEAPAQQGRLHTEPGTSRPPAGTCP